MASIVMRRSRAAFASVETRSNADVGGWLIGSLLLISRELKDVLFCVEGMSLKGRALYIRNHGQEVRVLAQFY